MDIEKLMPASKLEVKYLVQWDNGVRLMVSRGMPQDYIDADGKNLIGEGDIIELRMECDSPDVEDVALELSEETSFEVARGVVKALLCDKNLAQKVKFLCDLLRG